MGEKGTHVIQLQAHSVMDFIVGKFDMILVRRVPLLQHNLAPVRACLGSNQFLPLRSCPLKRIGRFSNSVGSEGSEVCG